MYPAEPAEPAGQAGWCGVFWSRLPPETLINKGLARLNLFSPRRWKAVMKPGSPAFVSNRLLDQLRERTRYLRHCQQTEKACLYWARFFHSQLQRDCHLLVVRMSNGK